MDDESGESTDEDDVRGTGRGESEIDWDEVDGEMQGARSRDKLKHIERNDQLGLFITRML